LRVTQASSAPLSPSFGGSIVRSDWERGGRPPCIASSLVFLLVVGPGVWSSLVRRCPVIDCEHRRWDGGVDLGGGLVVVPPAALSDLLVTAAIK
jgi:hypothetical protein